MDTYIKTAIDSGLNRDAIIIGLVTDEGLSLNKATNAYGKYARDNGLVTTIVSHKTEAMAELRERYAVDNWTVADVRAATVDLEHNYGVAESTARDYCKAYSKELGVPYPVENPREAMFQWFKDNDGSATKEAFIEYAVKELGRSRSNANEYWKGYELHLFLMA